MFSHARIAATLTLIMVTTTAAQQLPLFRDFPVTVPWVDSAGVNNGTATQSGNRIYLRDHAGNHIATVVIKPGGEKLFLDPNGKVIEQRVK